MQEKIPTPNQDRTKKTRAALMAAMRNLVLEKGFVHAGTPEIVSKAGVTRGALYHHFSDKRELFQAVIEQEIKTVAKEITRRGVTTSHPLEALKKGADAFIMTMAEVGRTRLILLEAPSVLGRTELLKIEDKYTRRTLLEGLNAAMDAGEITKLPLKPLMELMSAMFDSASLNIEAGMSRKQVLTVVHRIIDGLA